MYLYYLKATLEDGDRAAFVLAQSNVAEAKQIDGLSIETLLVVLNTVSLKMEFKSA